MKIKELLKLTIPPPGRGLKSYEIFGIKKDRSIQLKKLLAKETTRQMKPVTDLIAKLPKKPSEENRQLLADALDGIIAWTAPRKFIEVMAEIEVKNLNEANFVVFAFTMELFNRIQTNQSMAVEINNQIKAIPEADGKDQKSKV